MQETYLLEIQRTASEKIDGSVTEVGGSVDAIINKPNIPSYPFSQSKS